MGNEIIYLRTFRYVLHRMLYFLLYYVSHDQRTNFQSNVSKLLACVNTVSALEEILLQCHHQFAQFYGRYIDFKGNLAVTEISRSDNPWTE